MYSELNPFFQLCFAVRNLKILSRRLRSCLESILEFKLQTASDATSINIIEFRVGFDVDFNFVSLNKPYAIVVLREPFLPEG
jgi:hypothetical protein